MVSELLIYQTKPNLLTNVLIVCPYMNADCFSNQNFRFLIDFAGHRYNSAAANAQPVIRVSVKRTLTCGERFYHKMLQINEVCIFINTYFDGRNS